MDHHRAFIIAVVAAVTLLNVCRAVHKVEVNPSVVAVGLTKRLEVLCSFTREYSSLISSLFSLTVAHSSRVDSPVFSVIASINSFDNQMHGPALKHASNVSGVFNQSGESFIRITWNYPSRFNGGRYRCKASGLSGSGQSLDSIQGQIVKAEAPNINSVVLEMVDLDKKFDQLRAKIADYASAFRSRVNISASLRTQFEVSDVFRGNRYYLNTWTNLWTANEAHFRCHMYGGYLAEIEDANEFEFVRNFLIRKAQKFEEVMIGGSDEAVEGQWVYVYSNRPVLYKNFASGQPNNVRNSNYLCIWKPSFLMSDCQNYPNDEYSFLCEIPEANVPYS